MKKNIKIICAAMLLLSLNACGIVNYNSHTKVDKSGEISQSISTKVEQDYFTKKENPFLFKVDESKLSLKDSILTYSTIYSDGIYQPEQLWMSNLSSPEIKLEKKFRFFYTYYEYSCSFHEIMEKGPVPILDYLSEDEQALYFLGDSKLFQGLNGMEINELVDEVESKFIKWYSLSAYEISFQTLMDFIINDESKNDKILDAQKILKNLHITSFKNELYDSYAPKLRQDEFSMSKIATAIDDMNKVEVFSKIYKTNEVKLDKILDDKTKCIDLFQYIINYKLEMPGKVLSTNAIKEYEDGILYWRVDAFKILNSNYVLEAESRSVNIWAFVVAALVLGLISFFSFRKK